MILLSKKWKIFKKGPTNPNEYKKCSWTGELCKYPEEFQISHYSYKGKRLYQAFFNGLRARVNGKLITIQNPDHPNNRVWNEVQKEIRLQNGITSRKWLTADLTKQVYYKVYEKLGLEFPVLDKIEGGSNGRESQKVWRTEESVLSYFNIPEEDRQVWIGKYRVDGVKDKVVYEFFGDFYHANPRLYSPEDRIFNVTAKEKQRRDKIRLGYIRNKGYDVVVIWEKDWSDFQQGIISEKYFLDLLDRDSFHEVEIDSKPAGLERFMKKNENE